MVPTSKVCKGCAIDKPLDDFPRQKIGKYGRRSRCRDCLAVENAVYRATNFERRSEYNKQYRAANLEAVKEKNRAWNKANRDAAERATRAWRQRNPDMVLAQKLRHHARAKGLADVAYATAEKLRARSDFYADRCVYCLSPADSFDHRIPISRGGPHLPSNLVPCCLTCNSRKGDKTPREFAA